MRPEQIPMRPEQIPMRPQRSAIFPTQIPISPRQIPMRPAPYRDIPGPNGDIVLPNPDTVRPNRDASARHPPFFAPRGGLLSRRRPAGARRPELSNRQERQERQGRQGRQERATAERERKGLFPTNEHESPRIEARARRPRESAHHSARYFSIHPHRGGTNGGRSWSVACGPAVDRRAVRRIPGGRILGPDGSPPPRICDPARALPSVFRVKSTRCDFFRTATTPPSFVARELPSNGVAHRGRLKLSR